jgi:hypothetical protein
MIDIRSLPPTAFYTAPDGYNRVAFYWLCSDGYTVYDAVQPYRFDPTKPGSRSEQLMQHVQHMAAEVRAGRVLAVTPDGNTGALEMRLSSGFN